MRIVRALGLIAIMLATTGIVTSAYACPPGYRQCGPACCPG